MQFSAIITFCRKYLSDCNFAKITDTFPDICSRVDSIRTNNLYLISFIDPSDDLNKMLSNRMLFIGNWFSVRSGHVMRNNVTIRKMIIKYDKIHKFACVSSMDMIKINQMTVMSKCNSTNALQSTIRFSCFQGNPTSSWNSSYMREFERKITTSN